MTIRKGTRDDLPSVLELIRDLAEYEKAPKEVTITLADLETDGFGAHPLFHLFVASEGLSICGMALYFYSYSTWKGRCIYLEDLVVKEQYRRKGIGRLLFEALAAEARAFGAQRLQWQVLDWNEPALRFYRKMEAHLDGSWINGRLTSDQLLRPLP